MIRTHSFAKKEAHDPSTKTRQCDFCNNPVTHWTQQEGKHGKALSQCVYHCQEHRKEARQAV